MPPLGAKSGMGEFRVRSLAFILAATALLSACASFRDKAPAFAPQPPRTAWIVGGEGRAIGQATLTEAPGGVIIRLEFQEHALPPGWHGAHIHQIGNCSDPAGGFQASAAHVGHGDGPQHGLLNPMGPEAGDLPNIYASPTGTFGAEFFDSKVTLRNDIEGRMALLDTDGSALIIHAAADDHTSQPIGGAGARLACAAFSATP